jgi:hypothetical protein
MTNTWVDILVLIGWIIFALAVVAFTASCITFVVMWPLALAWAINNLFATDIPLTFVTWLSIWVVVWASKKIFGNFQFIKVVRK